VEDSTTWGWTPSGIPATRRSRAVAGQTAGLCHTHLLSMRSKV
jgi:hypothetical protein